MIDAEAVDLPARRQVEHQPVRRVEHFRVLDPESCQVVDVEEAPVVDLLGGNAPERKPVGLCFEQRIEVVEGRQLPLKCR